MPTLAYTQYILLQRFVFFVTGGTIHMVCRNKDKAEEARADIVKETGNKVRTPRFSSHNLDVYTASLDGIILNCWCHYRRFTSTSWTCLKPRRSGSLLTPSRGSTRLSMSWCDIRLYNLVWLSFIQHVLLLPVWLFHELSSVQINNSGSIMSQRDVNAEGLEMSFATNVLGESPVCG